MEIEKDEENSICSGFETDSNSLNIPSEMILTQKNDFISEINSLKYKLYHDQFASLFNKKDSTSLRSVSSNSIPFISSIFLAEFTKD